MRKRLGDAEQTMPSGRGVPLAHVESHGLNGDSADEPGRPQEISYLPDLERADFEGKSFHDRSQLTNPPAAWSPHATNMARNLYGLGGLAPAINEIDLYYSDHWLFGGMLKTGSAGQQPDFERCRVQSHSWVASMDLRINGQPVNFNDEILKRLDYLIQRDQVVAVVGRTGDAKPLLGRARNTISVGTSHAGAERPLIVAPASSTSLATAWVAACAALLLETADQTPSSREAELARRVETIRAVLLAGATKHESEFEEPWQRTADEPLSPRYGAGELNIDRSHAILAAGRQAARDSELVPLVGWDFTLVRPGRKRLYYFEVPTPEQVQSVSIVATWNRHVSVRRLSDALANVDVRLLHVERDFDLGKVVGAEERMGESASTTSNVEHIYAENLPPGRYVIEVQSDEPWDVAIAWNVQLVQPPSLRAGIATILLGVAAAFLMARAYHHATPVVA